MAIRIKARHGEHIGQMLRRFKKLCEKEGLTKEVKRRQYFEKPSERRRRARRKAISRLSRLASGPPVRGAARGGGRAGGRGGPARSGPSRGPGGRPSGGGGGRGPSR